MAVFLRHKPSKSGSQIAKPMPATPSPPLSPDLQNIEDSILEEDQSNTSFISEAALIRRIDDLRKEILEQFRLLFAMIAEYAPPTTLPALTILIIASK